MKNSISVILLAVYLADWQREQHLRPRKISHFTIKLESGAYYGIVYEFD